MLFVFFDVIYIICIFYINKNRVAYYPIANRSVMALQLNSSRDKKQEVLDV